MSLFKWTLLGMGVAIGALLTLIVDIVLTQSSEPGWGGVFVTIAGFLVAGVALMLQGDQ